ncbi:class I SAM-dependent methyltransferase [Nibricoccus aquaticus]|nr:class I SAM-dependent methyltransferase [Nibricoccus aquaticus]
MNPDEYDKMAEVEDRMWYYRALHARLGDFLRRGLANTGAARVLDAGCGTGGLLRRLEGEEPAWTLSGVDHSALACSYAVRRTGADIREASVTALPFGAASFDGIVSADVLYQIERPVEALKEFYRCLRPGGVVVINVPAYRWLWSYHDEMVQSKHRFGRGEMIALMKEAGFAVERSTYWNTLPFPLVVVRRKLIRVRPSEGDVRMYPASVEAAFNAAMTLERAWLRNVGGLPFGSSVLVVGRRSR